VAEAILFAVRNPKTTIEARMIFAHVPAAVGGRLDPGTANALESTLVDVLLADLAATKSLYAGNLLGQALTAVCRLPGAKSAPRVADALSGVICNPQTALEVLQPLAVALLAVNGQVPPKEAASHVSRAVTALDSLWGARTKPLDRAFIAEAQATVWTRLDPTEAAGHAGKVAVDLGGLFRDSKTGTTEHFKLAAVLVVVCEHLGPTERCTRMNAVADPLLVALRQSKNNTSLLIQHWGTLATFCVHLDRPGIDRVIDVFLASMSDLNMQRFLTVSSGDFLKKIAARLDEADLLRLLEHPALPSRLRRAVLDVLGEAKKRSFRNTWDYLDWIEAHGNGVLPTQSPQ
jgi:hypothetical protein